WSGRSAGKARSTRSAGLAAPGSDMVVLLNARPRVAPRRPISAMSRLTVRLATPTPSLLSWTQTLRTPYTPKFSSKTRRISGLSCSSRWRRADRPLRLPFTCLRLVVGGGGHRQLPADGLDPELLPVVIDESDHRLGWRSSSAWAKYADAFLRISFARRNSTTSRRSSFNSARSSE